MGNPKHADVLLVANSASYYNYRVLRNLYKQMPDLKSGNSSGNLRLHQLCISQLSKHSGS
jgi:Ni,Fe-hydrogenase III small subunit